jgi:hypothetical protein
MLRQSVSRWVHSSRPSLCLPLFIGVPRRKVFSEVHRIIKPFSVYPQIALYTHLPGILHLEVSERRRS